MRLISRFGARFMHDAGPRQAAFERISFPVPLERAEERRPLRRRNGPVQQFTNIMPSRSSVTPPFICQPHRAGFRMNRLSTRRITLQL